MSIACIATPTGLGLCGYGVCREPNRAGFKKHLQKLANVDVFSPGVKAGKKYGLSVFRLPKMTTSSSDDWMANPAKLVPQDTANYRGTNNTTKVPRLTNTRAYTATQSNGSTRRDINTGYPTSPRPVNQPVVNQQQKQPVATANPSAPVNSTAPVNANASTAGRPAKPYGFVNRLSDIWRMLINRIKLWWYQSKMRSGNMTESEWKTVQTAASELGTNKTARWLGNWWDPDEYGAGYFDGLGNLTKQLPNIHKLRGYADVISSADKGIPQKIKAGADAAGLIYNHGKNIQSAMDWGHKYGYINDEDYGAYNKYIGKIPKIK